MLTPPTGMIYHTETVEITAHVNVAQDTDMYLGPKKHTALNRDARINSVFSSVGRLYFLMWHPLPFKLYLQLTLQKLW